MEYLLILRNGAQFVLFVSLACYCISVVLLHILLVLPVEHTPCIGHSRLHCLHRMGRSGCTGIPLPREYIIPDQRRHSLRL